MVRVLHGVETIQQPITLTKLIRAIQSVLSRNLLSDEQKLRLTPLSHPTAGHCYIASEALYHMYGKKAGYIPHYLYIGNNRHWFLKNKKTGVVLDPTSEQFSEPVEYSVGIGCGFLTGDKPSKRCLEVLRRIRTV